VPEPGPACGRGPAGHCETRRTVTVTVSRRVSYHDAAKLGRSGAQVRWSCHGHKLVTEACLGGTQSLSQGRAGRGLRAVAAASAGAVLAVGGQGGGGPVPVCL
jgi:hypothetical protein